MGDFPKFGHICGITITYTTAVRDFVDVYYGLRNEGAYNSKITMQLLLALFHNSI